MVRIVGGTDTAPLLKTVGLSVPIYPGKALAQLISGEQPAMRFGFTRSTPACTAPGAHHALKLQA